LLRTIILPSDGSPLSERALTFGVRLPRAAGTELVLIRAAHTAAASVVTNASAARIAAARLEVERSEAEAALATIADGLRKEGLSVRTSVPLGSPAKAILEAGRSTEDDLIVMATHGRSEVLRSVFGSVADEVLRHAAGPIMFIPPNCHRPCQAVRPLCILVPLDGSPHAEEALSPAVALADLLGAELRLLQVLPQGVGSLSDTDLDRGLREATAYLERTAAPLRADHHPVEVRALTGTPPSAIASAAGKELPDMIAMASHGRGGLARVVLGSVATGVLRQATVPVLIVRPAAIQAAA
jgi:nucleotide-binding universal stress UspA family protein